MAELANTYLVHGADCKCNMGLRPSKVVLQRSHGVFLKGMAQVTEEDCRGGIHILNFCGCHSAENPDTIAMAKQLSEIVEEATGEDFSNEVVDIFCQGGNGGVKTMQCAGECYPQIVSETWDMLKDTVKTDEKCAVKGTATLKCLYGGIIEIINAGQPE